jgi:hypothetical protein
MGPSPLVLSKKIRTARRCNNFAVPSSSGIRLGGNHKSHCAASPGSQLNRPRWIDPSMLRPLLSAAKEPDENPDQPEPASDEKYTKSSTRCGVGECFYLTPMKNSPPSDSHGFIIHQVGTLMTALLAVIVNDSFRGML